MKTIKSFLFVITLPVLLIVCFKQDQLGIREVNRSPAVIHMTKMNKKVTIPSLISYAHDRIK